MLLDSTLINVYSLELLIVWLKVKDHQFTYKMFISEAQKLMRSRNLWPAIGTRTHMFSSSQTAGSHLWLSLLLPICIGFRNSRNTENVFQKCRMFCFFKWFRKRRAPVGRRDWRLQSWGTTYSAFSSMQAAAVSSVFDRNPDTILELIYLELILVTSLN